MKFFKFLYLLFFVDKSVCMWNNVFLNNQLDRRSFLTLNSLITSNLNNKVFSTLSPSLNNIEEKIDDPYTHWSFFELAPPPIKKTITKDELEEEINNNSIFSLQIAIQHNCIIATTKEGYRYACLISDKEFSSLISKFIGKGGQLPFYLLPIDPIRSKIRKFAQIFFSIFAIGYVAADLDIIDIDTSSYSSIKERNEAQKFNKKPRKLLKSLLESLYNMTKS